MQKWDLSECGVNHFLVRSGNWVFIRTCFEALRFLVVLKKKRKKKKRHFISLPRKYIQKTCIPCEAAKLIKLPSFQIFFASVF